MNNYIIITPVFNEESYISTTLESVVNQTFIPYLWVIVDDGSTDKSTEIISEYSNRYSWIKLVVNKQKNKRSVGAKVVNAFYIGYDLVKNLEFTFIVKLDADLTLPSNYFEKINNAYNEDSTIGMAAGYCIINKKGKWVSEGKSDYHIRGPIKSYRKECFVEIGGIKRILGWDGLDNMEALYKGWRIKVLDIKVKHHRIMGKESSVFLANRHGKAYYQRGFSLFHALIRSFSILINEKKPIKSFLFLISFIVASLKREPKVVDKSMQRFTRKIQNKRIFNYKIYKE